MFPKRRLLSLIPLPLPIPDGGGGTLDNEVTLHLALVALGMNSRHTGVEAGQKADAKVSPKPKVAVSGINRRNLRHATSSNVYQGRKLDSRRETSPEVMNAVATAVRNENLTGHLKIFYWRAFYISWYNEAWITDVQQLVLASLLLFICLPIPLLRVY